MAKQVNKFRTSFQFVKENLNWFPGHMARGVKQMQQKLKMVDCIIEVHDARIPLSGRNPNFYHLLTAARPHILVLNKKDLANLNDKMRIKEVLRQKMGDTHMVFTDCHREGCSGVRQIVPMAIDLIKSSHRVIRAENDLNIMIIGIPNVGKSSLINSLRSLHLKKAKAARVGAIPGITRSLMSKIKVSDNPTMYLFDTPGILQPNITNVEIGLKLALCATIEESVVNIINKADFFLYWANKHEEFSYVNFLGLDEPTDDIYKVLIHIAQKQNFVKHIRSFNGPLVAHPDVDSASYYFVKAFQSGKLGKFTLDIDLIRKFDSGGMKNE